MSWVEAGGREISVAVVETAEKWEKFLWKLFTQKDIRKCKRKINFLLRTIS